MIATPRIVPRRNTTSMMSITAGVVNVIIEY
jgi:hypothetical protein